MHPIHKFLNYTPVEKNVSEEQREKSYLLLKINNSNCGKILFQSFKRYVFSKTSNIFDNDFEMIENEDEFVSKENDFEKLVTLDFHCQSESHRTYFLEALQLSTLINFWGMLIPTPNWGQYTVKTSISVKDKKDTGARLNYEARSDFSKIYYSLFETEYKEDAFKRAFNATFEMIKSDFASTGKEIKIIQDEPRKIHIEEEGVRIYQKGNSSFEKHITLELKKINGRTSATAFYTDEENNETKGAEGVGTQDELNFNLSLYTDKTRFYLSPETGYFLRTVTLKDFGYDVSDFNRGSSGFIPGETTNPETGEIIDISSLSYRATFHSIYGGLKAGFNMGFGTNSFHNNVNFYYTQNFLEFKRTKIDNSVDSFIKYDIPFASFDAFFSSSSIGFDYSLMIPATRCGLKIGFDGTIYRKFNFEKPIEFRENYYDDELKIYRQHRIYSTHSDLESALYYLTLFVIL